MAKLYDISNWNEQPWWNTGGTRDKKIYLNPTDNELYFFKQSFKKGQRDFKYEFWSEIIASEIGESLGFDILPYDIAIAGNVIGCISKSMHNPANEELVEGGKYLQAFDTTFNPENTKLRHQYNFTLIAGALAALKLDKYYKNIIEIIVFDALIGNSDRHQENWAIINIHSYISKSLAEMENVLEGDRIKDMPYLVRKFFEKYYLVKGKIKPGIRHTRLKTAKQTKFAPIYDSGCSFGRELEDERVINLLNNQQELEKYVNKGLAEIHWGSKKVSHFELIENLLEEDKFGDMLKETIGRVKQKYNETKIKEIINKVDGELVKLGNVEYLPNERKQLMLKLVTLRLNKLILFNK